MNPEYPEIERLNEVYVKYRFSWKIDRSQNLVNQEYYPLIRFELEGHKFHLFVDDEYDDLRLNYPLLNLCLILRELEGYEFTSHYETWCQERFFDPENEQVRENFKHLSKVYMEVEKILGKIDSYVSDFDFEMNAGAAQKLRRSS